MHADVERFSFDPAKRFLRVIEQQGRVMLAADSNEQAAILVAFLRDLAVDVIGDFGTPAGPSNNKPGPGFQVTLDDGRIRIGQGRFWVDGLLCVNDTDLLPYEDQPDYPAPPKLPTGKVVVYLDLWERHVSSAQDPSIRDVALGGPDTCTRSRLVWQVKTAEVRAPGGSAGLTGKGAVDLWRKMWRDQIDGQSRGRMAVEVERATGPADPCQVPAGAGYYGNENQLYRVEVHRGSGVLGANGEELPATFKWSRDNGSVVYPLSRIEGTVAVLQDPPVDCTKQLTTGTLVEVVDDLTTLLGRPGVLARVVEVDDDGDDVVIHLSKGPAEAILPQRHPLLRRWDHPAVEGGPAGAAAGGGGGGAGPPADPDDDGALKLVEEADPPLALEDGIVVRFEAGGHRYRTGDYWTFPARAAIGDVIWPRDDNGDALAVGPHGIEHHLAPLAVVDAVEGMVTGAVVDCRVGFPRLATLFA
jgi:hypothetical protein